MRVTSNMVWRVYWILIAVLAVLPGTCFVSDVIKAWRDARTNPPAVVRPDGAPPATSLYVDDLRILQGDLDAHQQVRDVSIVARRVGRADLERLNRLPGLKRLSIFGADLDADALAVLAELPGLRELYLDWTRCPPAGWQSLANHAGFSRISLEGADVPAELVRTLAAAMGHGQGEQRSKNDCPELASDHPTECDGYSDEASDVSRTMLRYSPPELPLPVSPEAGRVIRPDDNLAAKTTLAMRRAGAFYGGLAIAGGGYVESFPADATVPTAGSVIYTVGTANVGAAQLAAYEATGERLFLERAVAAGRVLASTQLGTGGWGARGELDPLRRGHYGYRVDGAPQGGHGTYLDYPYTRTTVEFLMQLDVATQGVLPEIHAASIHCLDSLLKHQYPNGGWPLWLRGQVPDRATHPIQRAVIPQHWSRIRTREGYAHYRYDYTLNDNVTPDVVRVLLRAAELYKDERYQAAALRGGDFFLLAQLPDPQPAWAQQYNTDMVPSWGRSFEPPAITARESQVVVNTLLELYAHSLRRKYLDAAGRALDYLERCVLPDGRLARFYELGSNRPLYVNRWYMLTYSDSHLLGHYALKSGNSLGPLRERYEALKSQREIIELVADDSVPDAGHVTAIIGARTTAGPGWKAARMGPRAAAYEYRRLS